MKRLKLIVSSLIVMVSIFSAQPIKTEISLKDGDRVLANTLLDSHFIKNMYLYGPHNDPLKHLVWLLWNIENQSAVPTKKGPFAAITPEICNALMAHVYTGDLYETQDHRIIEDLVNKFGWVEIYKNQMPERIKQLEEKNKKIERTLQKLNKKQSAAAIQYTRDLQAKINNPTYKISRHKTKREEKCIEQKIKKKHAVFAEKNNFIKIYQKICKSYRLIYTQKQEKHFYKNMHILNRLT